MIEEIKPKKYDYDYFPETKEMTAEEIVKVLFNTIEGYNAVLSQNKALVEALELAYKHIDGKGEKFSEREKTPVLYQIKQVLTTYKGEIEK